jgi:hypothetical protein
MSRRKRTLSRDDFDEFTKHRLTEIGGRFNDARRLHQRAERLLWLGTLAAAFDDDELSILGAMGFLSPADRDLLRSAGRPVRTWPPRADAPGP